MALQTGVTVATGAGLPSHAASSPPFIPCFLFLPSSIYPALDMCTCGGGGGSRSSVCSGFLLTPQLSALMCVRVYFISCVHVGGRGGGTLHSSG